MLSLAQLKPIIQEMIASDVVMGPALASVGIGGLSKDTYDMIREEAKTLTDAFWPHPSPIVDHAVPVPTSMLLSSVCETLTSTAAYLSHLKLGYLKIDETMVRVAARLFDQFARTHNVYDLQVATLLVTGYDDYQAINHYGEVEQSAFISGELHRPWVHYALQDELQYMIDVGSVTVDSRNGQQYVRLTERGRERFENIRDLLQDTGFLQRRITLMRWSQFSQLEDYDELVGTLTNGITLRAELVNRCGIKPGMNVLELGCGTGCLTLDTGLYQRVGPQGTITATDPSIGMLNRAKAKLGLFDAPNVKFLQAQAEYLPFPEDSFDAMTGMAFFQFTDMPVALQEIHRVAKPEALFTTVFPLQFPQTNAFFVEWFAPLLAIAKLHPGHRDILPTRETAMTAIDPKLFTDLVLAEVPIISYFQYPEMIVQFFIKVINPFEAAMNQLPWRAQQDMIDLLTQRGYDIVRKYGAKNLVQIHPGQFLQVRVVK